MNRFAEILCEHGDSESFEFEECDEKMEVTLVEDGTTQCQILEGSGLFTFLVLISDFISIFARSSYADVIFLSSHLNPCGIP